MKGKRYRLNKTIAGFFKKSFGTFDMAGQCRNWVYGACCPVQMAKTARKFDNLQYDKLVGWLAGTNDSSPSVISYYNFLYSVYCQKKPSATQNQKKLKRYQIVHIVPFQPFLIFEWQLLIFDALLAWKWPYNIETKLDMLFLFTFKKK